MNERKEFEYPPVSESNYHNMTVDELEREAYRTHNKLAIALLDRVEKELKEQFAAALKLNQGD